MSAIVSLSRYPNASLIKKMIYVKRYYTQAFKVYKSHDHRPMHTFSFINKIIKAKCRRIDERYVMYN